MTDTFETPAVVYSPEPALQNPSKVVREMFRDLFAGRELAWQLALREIRAQYRQTVLGYLWIFAVPVANSAVWILIHGSGVITVGDTGMSYPVFVLTGTIFWSIVMDAVNAPLRQTIAAKSMLTKIKFPHEALILSGAYLTLFSSAIRLTVLIVVLPLFGMSPGWTLLLAPFAVLALVLAGTTLGVLITPVGLLYGDIGRGLPLLLQFLMFLSPVVYPVPKSGLAASLVEWNPLTPLIVTARALLTGQVPETFVSVSLVTLGIVCILFFAWAAYRIAMPILIERMSA